MQAECYGFDAARGREQPRSQLSYLEGKVAALEIELAKLKIKNGDKHTEDKDKSVFVVENLTSQLALVIAQPAGLGQARRDNKSDTSIFGSLLSQTYLMQSPPPSFGGHGPLPPPSHVTPQLRRSNIASIPRNVIDIMLKNYCEIYLIQYPTVEETALYKSCDKIYLDNGSSHFDIFSVAMVLAISVKYHFPIQAELTATGKYTYKT